MVRADLALVLHRQALQLVHPKGDRLAVPPERQLQRVVHLFSDVVVAHRFLNRPLVAHPARRHRLFLLGLERFRLVLPLAVGEGGLALDVGPRVLADTCEHLGQRLHHHLVACKCLGPRDALGLLERRVGALGRRARRLALGREGCELLVPRRGEVRVKDGLLRIAPLAHLAPDAAAGIRRGLVGEQRVLLCLPARHRAAVPVGLEELGRMDFGRIHVLERPRLVQKGGEVVPQAHDVRMVGLSALG